jgi:phenylpropionate dioxygenase-like ring-hydroxylating dioxygenase large terminal subunit
MIASHIDIDSLIDDRPAEGVFRVRREIFTDQQVFDLEMQHIFEGTWMFVGLESELPKAHDFITATVGRQPVLVTRDGAGKLGAFLNSCRHRGTIVNARKCGNQKYHVCPYHGWAYNSGGRNIAITNQREGCYPDAFTADNHDLVAVPRFGNYRGLLFVSLSADVVALEEHLGDARIFLDMVLDQGRQGLEFLPGTITYTFDANWKLQFENGTDHYHFASTHVSYAELLQSRWAAEPPGPAIYEEPDAIGSFNFQRGHSVMWGMGDRGTIHMNAIRPLARDPDRVEELVDGLGELRARWMLRNRHVTLFPNAQFADIMSLQVRTWRPLGPNKTEMISRCLGIVGESPEARQMRVRQFEDFFNPSGLATPDDSVMYELCQIGYQASGAGWTQGHSRGMTNSIGSVSNKAKELGFNPAGWAEGDMALGDETNFHEGYREWRRLLKRGLEQSHGLDGRRNS